MIKYVSGIIAAVIVGALVTFLVPHGKGTEKYVKFASSLVVILMILSPLRDVSDFITAIKNAVGVLEAGSTVPEDSFGTADKIIEKSAENISEYIISVAEEKFSFDANAIKVRLVLNADDTENVAVEEAQLYTAERDKVKRDALARYLEEKLSFDVHVFGP